MRREARLDQLLELGREGSVAVVATAVTTNASRTSPRSSSGRPTTATLTTAGWVINTLSTSNGPIR